MSDAPVFGKVSVESYRERQRIRRLERAKKDLQQSVFFKAEEQIVVKANPNRFAMVAERGIDPFKKTTCPFCLGYSQLRKFLISTKKGFDRGRGQCPLCEHGMKLQTLVKMEKWGAKDYAAWVFDYRRSGFWQKITFDTWKKRLELMGWTKEFWDEYKRLRGDAPEGFSKEEDEQYSGYDESMKV